jgi:Fe-S cluster assembly iron-binding protein IscA
LGLALDEPKSDDEELTINDVPVLVSARDKDSVMSAVVDYTKSTYGEGFSVRSDHSSTC